MQCTKCKSNSTIKHGIRKNKNIKRQIYFCKDCKSFFSEQNKFIDSIYQKEILKMVLELFCKGESYKSISETINKKKHT